MSTAFPPSAWIWPFLHKNRPPSFIIDDSACFVNQESEVQEKKATATTAASGGNREELLACFVNQESEVQEKKVKAPPFGGA
jgi:hypothetical protein